MARLNVEVENGKIVRASMHRAENRIVKQVQDDSLEEYAKKLRKEIVETAPVDTGEYRDNWAIEEKGDGYIIYNSTEHGKYLVFPNSRMVGSPKADKPGEGIIHNVRGIVFKDRRNFVQKIKNDLRKLIAGP